MSLRILTRRIRMDLVSDDEDVCSLLFTQSRSRRACRLFLDYLKVHRSLTRVEMSRFADDLAAGRVEKGFRYSRRQFYTQVRRTLLTLGLISIEQRLVSSQDFDVVSERLKEKYVAVRQPIAKRPPDGLNLVRLMWIICKRWNDEFLGDVQDGSG